MKPRMFIASSVERLELAYAAQENLEHDLEVTVWTQGVFALSKTSLASLLDEMGKTDFGLFIVAPDDVTEIRNKSLQTVRDNIIFELGLFIGHLGIERCFLVIPKEVDDLHLPSDLLGLEPAKFDPVRQDGNLHAALGPACNRIRAAARKLGQLAPAISPVAASPTVSSDTLISDKDDCIVLIESWMGDRSVSANTKAIKFTDVDKELRLAPGSAMAYIEKAALRWGYKATGRGKDFIMFSASPPY